MCKKILQGNCLIEEMDDGKKNIFMNAVGIAWVIHLLNEVKRIVKSIENINRGGQIKMR